jgi:hypothetical protein
LNARIDRVAQLFAWIEAREGAAARPFAAALARLLARYDDDRRHYSEILEPSVSQDGRGRFWRRFSYAFPGFANARSETLATLADLCAPFGAQVAAAAARVIRAARHPAVAQPLFGLADDGADGTRVKLYLQFDDGAGDEALALAGALLGMPLDGGAWAGRLHMLGLDLGPAGLCGAKLYVAAADARHAPPGLALTQLLHVYRLAAPGQPLAPEPDEIDFGLADNGLTDDDLGALAAAHPGPFGDLAALGALLPLALRRVSLGRRDPAKVTLYYVLTELSAE